MNKASQKGQDKIQTLPGGGVWVQPFLKWPGGKRWLVPLLRELIEGIAFNTYREPFLGGGALFFALRPKSAVLSDVNADLINTYRQVKFRSQLLLDSLRELPIDQTTFDRLRRSSDGSPIHRATRFPCTRPVSDKGDLKILSGEAIAVVRASNASPIVIDTTPNVFRFSWKWRRRSPSKVQGENA